MRHLAVLLGVLLLTVIYYPSGSEGYQNGERSYEAPAADGNLIIVDQGGNGDYLTINEAVASAQPHDEIRIYDGTYYENVLISKPLTIVGNGTDKVMIIENENKYTFKLSSNNITISNINFSNDGDKSQYGCIIVENAENVLIENCSFNVCYWGVRVFRSHNINIDDNKFFNHIQPMSISGLTDKISARRNEIYNGINWSVVHLASDNVQFIDNKMFNSSLWISLGYSEYTVKNNTINDIPILFVKDLNNFSDVGNYSQYFFSNCENIALRNLQTKNVYVSVYLWHCNNIILENSIFEDNLIGIQSNECDEFIIKNNSFNNTMEGIDGNGDSNVIDGNRFFDCNIPVSIGGDYIRVVNNSIFNSSFLEIRGDNITIDNNEINYCENGIMTYVHRGIIRNNKLTNIMDRAILVRDNSYDIEIMNNTIKNTSYGIVIKINDEGNIYIHDEIIEDCMVGIQTRGLNTLIESVVILNASEIGCDLIRCREISSSNFIGNHIGIYLNETEDCWIYKNIIENNEIGIKTFDSEYNTIVSNQFIDNAENAIVSNHLDRWYESLPVGGNYWSDYEGKDVKKGSQQNEPGSDGFGDDPYYIEETFSDKYPIFKDDIPPVIIPWNSSLGEGSSYHFDLDSCSDNQMIVKAVWEFTHDDVDYLFEKMEYDFTFNKPGLVEVNLTVFDFANNSDKEVIWIDVKDLLFPKAVVEKVITGYPGENILLDGSNSTDTGEISSYEWRIQYHGEEVILYGERVHRTFERPGIFSSELKVTDSIGHSNNIEFTLIIIDEVDPIADAGKDIVCSNWDNVSLDGSGSFDLGIIRYYNWSFLDNEWEVILDGNNPSYVFEHPGRYNITLEVTDQFENRGSDNLTVTVRDTIKPIPAITGIRTILQNENIKLSGKTSTDNGKIVNYQWEIMDNGSHLAEGADLDYKVEIRGYHKVFLTVYDEWGNLAMTNVSVNAIDGNKPFTSAGPDQEVIVGTRVILNGSRSHDDGIIVKYEWTLIYNNEKLEMLGKVTAFKFDKAGKYEVTLKVYDESENSGSDAVTITVKNTGIVKGIVLDDKGDPIAGALVEITASDGKTYTFTTAPDGAFSLEIPAGSFTWKISKSGYGTITGSSTVNVLGENTMDLAGTPMKETASTGTSPILFIVPILIILVLIIAVVIFLLIKKKKTAPVVEGTKPEDEAIPPEQAQADATAESTPIPPEASDFVQAPPVMDEDVPVQKAVENATIDDLLEDK